MPPLASDAQRFVLRTRQSHGEAVVELQGQVDVSTASELTQALSRLALNGNVVILDLSAADLADSAALAALVLAQKSARRARGDLVLAGVTGKTLRMLELTGLDRVFLIQSQARSDSLS